VYPYFGPLRVSGCTEIRVLDGMRCVHGGSGDAVLHGVQPRLVFACLVMNRGRPVTAETLADLLWTTGRATHWEGAVRGVVAKVRAFLQHADQTGARIENEGHTYRLVCDPSVTVDLWQAEHDLVDVGTFVDHRQWASAAAPADRVVTQLGGTLLPGVQHDALDQWRSDIAKLRRRSLRLASTAASHCGSHDHAVAYAEAAVADEQFDEEGHRGLIAAYLAAGNRSQALRAYGRCRRMLAAELGVAPSPATEALYLQALGAEPITAAALGCIRASGAGRVRSAQTVLLCGEA
jgi:DNA-binding SARP family transcriptional activator